MSTSQPSHHTHLVVTLLLTALQIPETLGQCATRGTTPRIRDIVQGRCLEYHTFINPDQYCNNGEKRNCTDLADLFESAFAFQPTCNVSFDRYADFIQAAHFDVTSGQSMFWSDVYGVVQRYTDRGRRARALEDTLIGYMADGLRFCAQEAEPGVIYDSDCAGFDQTENCPYNAEYSFWVMASSNYASTAQGEARVMLNASLAQAYYDTSFFGVWEIPNMDPSKVTKLTILLVHIPGQEIRSTCKSDNIARLQQKLTARNITSACEDSPWGPQAMLCMDYPDVEECKREATGVGTSVHRTMGLLCLILIKLLLLTF